MVLNLLVESIQILQVGCSRSQVPNITNLFSYIVCFLSRLSFLAGPLSISGIALSTFHIWVVSRSSRPEVLIKKGVVRNFANFTGKQLYQSLFFNNVAGLRP